jgi:hypothetical protein
MTIDSNYPRKKEISKLVKTSIAKNAKIKKAKEISTSLMNFLKKFSLSVR